MHQAMGNSNSLRLRRVNNGEEAGLRRVPCHRFIHSLREGVTRLPFTARIERALLYRARSASKKGTCLSMILQSSLVSPKRRWLTVPPTARVQRGLSEAARCASKGDRQLPPTALLQKQPHPHLLSLDPGPAERFDDLPGQHLRHFYQRESIHHFNSANHI